MKKKTQHTEQHVAALRNRWVLEFDASLGIDQFNAQSISQISYDGLNKKWNPVQFSLIETITSNVLLKLVEGSKREGGIGPIHLKCLDGPGNVGSQLVFVKYDVIEVLRDPLDYGNDELVLTHLIIRPIQIAS